MPKYLCQVAYTTEASVNIQMNTTEGAIFPFRHIKDQIFSTSVARWSKSSADPALNGNKLLKLSFRVFFGSYVTDRYELTLI